MSVQVRIRYSCPACKGQGTIDNMDGSKSFYSHHYCDVCEDGWIEEWEDLDSVIDRVRPVREGF